MVDDEFYSMNSDAYNERKKTDLSRTQLHNASSHFAKPLVYNLTGH